MEVPPPRGGPNLLLNQVAKSLAQSFVQVDSELAQSLAFGPIRRFPCLVGAGAPHARDWHVEVDGCFRG